MNDVQVAFAKLAGIQKALTSTLNEEAVGPRPGPYRNFAPSSIEPYFDRAWSALSVLCANLPALYADFHMTRPGGEVAMTQQAGQAPALPHYSRRQVEKLYRDIDQILEIRANSELEGPSGPVSGRESRVFISHGSSKDWYSVQRFIETDLKYQTLELAQEPSLGKTVIEKLEAESARCSCAVIVMTGDDLDSGGTPRARENVMHEVGFFQGKFGRNRVCLLHEEGVSVPTNLSGVVYSPFPKGYVEASFTLLARELKLMTGAAE